MLGLQKFLATIVRGPVVQTKNPLDFMIEGEGYFTIHTDEGVRYTRDGAYLKCRWFAEYQIRSPCNGRKGCYRFKKCQFEVNARGEIYSEGKLVDKLKTFNFSNPKSLERVGDNLYFYNGPEAEQVAQKTARVQHRHARRIQRQCNQEYDVNDSSSSFV